MLDLLSNGNRLHLEDDLFDDDEEAATANNHENGHENNNKSSKNKRKRNRKKKSNNKGNAIEMTPSEKNDETNEGEAADIDNHIEIELVAEEVELDKNFAEFAKIFEHFKFTTAESLAASEAARKELENKEKQVAPTSKEAELERLKARMLEDEEDEEKNRLENKDGQPKLSKKKLKLASRLSVAALKQLVNRPDVVEMHDITAQDPKLLVHLKATRNTVTVPRHWCAKRKYLQGKRGFEKPPFELPDFIKRTGIQTMREAVAEKDANKSLKQKMREKVRPKMGRIDIDYQKLHDAFFKWQTKPRMTIHGELYYEGKELETRLREKKPGNLSDDLRIALGMPAGPNADKVPPPWLIAMQRYGPPPSYPSLKIPGLNAPIPEGCSFGYHAGGWGKPPVDEFGRPLYGDVFGTTMSSIRKPVEEEEVDPTLWGEMEEEVYEEVMPDEDSEEEEGGDEEQDKEATGEEDGDEEERVNEAGLKTPGEGLATPSGISTTTTSAGLETPDMIELRKKRNQIESEMDIGESGEAPVLYKILPEKATSVGGSMMGSSKVYDIGAARNIVSGTASIGVDMALNPDELEMSSEVLQSRYDQMRQSAGGGDEEFGDEKQQKKNKKKESGKSGAASSAVASSGASSEKDKNKKYKEFKF